MILAWAENAWEDYLYWQRTDKQILQRIKALIKDVKRQPFKGSGDPEPLRCNWRGYWSRRINRQQRLVYKVMDDMVIIAQCRYHCCEASW
jgi:toxin YoeB